MCLKAWHVDSTAVRSPPEFNRPVPRKAGPWGLIRVLECCLDSPSLQGSKSLMYSSVSMLLLPELRLLTRMKTCSVVGEGGVSEVIEDETLLFYLPPLNPLPPPHTHFP